MTSVAVWSVCPVFPVSCNGEQSGAVRGPAATDSLESRFIPLAPRCKECGNALGRRCSNSKILRGEVIHKPCIDPVTPDPLSIQKKFRAPPVLQSVSGVIQWSRNHEDESRNGSIREMDASFAQHSRSNRQRVLFAANGSAQHSFLVQRGQETASGDN